ncbi:hypothetical protein [Saccharothrix sp. HUAS TT1]|uniref:hypothetical protein n=1 Tax=unclassified Saccharothrix TaxID=2593673 RepID=UPI00345C10CD
MIRRGPDRETVREVITAHVGEGTAAEVLADLDGEWQDVDPGDADALGAADLRHVEAAQVLLTALNGLDALPPSIVAGDVDYGTNNTYRRYLGEDDALSPLAHVRNALLVPLIALTGDADRAEELLYDARENDWDVATALRVKRRDWATEQAGHERRTACAACGRPRPDEHEGPVTR